MKSNISRFFIQDDEFKTMLDNMKLKKSIMLLVKSRKLQGRIKFHGLDISIENRKGSVRRGVDPNGHEWKTKMKYPYGYIRMTEGQDSEHVDVYIGNNRESERVFVVHQVDPYNHDKYDEDKVMLGFTSPVQAKKAYLQHYDNPGFFGSMEEFGIDDFSDKVKRKKGKITGGVLRKAKYIKREGVPGKYRYWYKEDVGREQKKESGVSNKKISSKKDKTSIETPEFKKWFGNSKVVDREGNPLIVYHGGTGELNDFSRGAERGYLGKVYFTKTKDTAEKYAYLGGIDDDIGDSGEDYKDKYDSVMDSKSGKEYEKLKNRKPKVVPAYMTIKNPLNIERVGFDDVIKHIGKKAIMDIVKGEVEGNEEIEEKADAEGQTVEEYLENNLEEYLEDTYGVQDNETWSNVIGNDFSSLYNAHDDVLQGSAAFLFLLATNNLDSYQSETGNDGIIYEDYETKDTTYVPINAGQVKSIYNEGAWDENNSNLQKSLITHNMISESLRIKLKSKDYNKYDQKQLKMGTAVEMEHTKDKALAQYIASQHLDEFPDYYTRLKEMEDEAKEDVGRKIVPSIDNVKVFLSKHPNPDDETVHKWAEKNNYDKHKVENLLYRLATKGVSKSLQGEGMLYIPVLLKAKYLKREGSPGHYKYFYKENVGVKRSKKESGSSKNPKSVKDKFLEVTESDNDELKKHNEAMFPKLKGRYDLGKRIAEKHPNQTVDEWTENAMYGDYGKEEEDIAVKLATAWNHTSNKFFDYGFAKKEIPNPVIAWRFGDIPKEGRSYNFAQQIREGGISTIKTSDNEKVGHVLQASINSVEDRPLVKMVGYKLEGSGIGRRTIDCRSQRNREVKTQKA
ncbi:MAG: DUF5661 family protein [Patescibacteria group bacterium]|jgi:hypothetical protein